MPRDPNPDSIRGWLHTIAEAGYDHVEISLDMVPMIVSGRLKYEYVSYFKSLLAELNLTYSAHIGSGVNARDARNRDLQISVLHASVDVCAELHLSPLVLHYELQTRDNEIERHFIECHRKLAEYANERDVALCIENIEVEVIKPVVQLVKAVSHNNLKMAFDIGHAFLSSRYYKYDFIESVKLVREYISHVHVSDNVGRFEELRITNRPQYDALSLGDRFSFGRGDIHLPPFWGDIPLERVFRILNDYNGIFVCEFYAQYFRPFLEATRRRVEKGILQGRNEKSEA